MGSESTTSIATPATEADRPTLLIVDDEAGPRESLRIVFKDRFHCAVATCGRDGIAYAKDHHVDAAIVDIKMPDVSGIEVLRELKEIDPNIECIMLTGYETIETARAAVRYGAADYLNKPFDVFAMRDLIDKCLSRRQRKVSSEEQMAHLQKTNEELRRDLIESNRAVAASVLSSGVVHEMNNPLSIIAGYSDLLGRDLAKLAESGTDAAQVVHQRLATIQSEIERCKQIAKRFLMFSRGANQNDELVEARRIVEDTASLVKAHPANRGVTIEVEPIDEQLMVRVHPTDILQVFINLGVNSLQAMEGRGNLWFSAVAVSDVPVGLLATKGADFAAGQPHVKFSVRDSGKGIPADQIKRIFEPYFTTKDHGTGLGLAIVSELVGKHRGGIEVDSEPGKGTTVNVYLPRPQ